MEHDIHSVIGFEQVDMYALRVKFEDGRVREIDFAPVLSGGLLAALRDPEVFRRVRIDPEAATLVWPNGADFDPATLYDWPEVADELAERTRSWEPAPRSR